RLPEKAEGEARAGGEQQAGARLVSAAHMCVNLVRAAADPPEQRPRENDNGQPGLPAAQTLAVALQVPVGEEAGAANKRAAEIEAVEHGYRAVRALYRRQKRETGRNLQEQPERARQPALLPHAGPQDGCPLE